MSRKNTITISGNGVSHYSGEVDDLPDLPESDDSPTSTIEAHMGDILVESVRVNSKTASDFAKKHGVVQHTTVLPITGLELDPSEFLTWPEFRELVFDNAQIDGDVLDEIVAGDDLDVAEALASLDPTSVTNSFEAEDEDYYGPVAATLGNDTFTVWVLPVEEPILVARPKARSANEPLTLVLPYVSPEFLPEIQNWLANGSDTGPSVAAPVDGELVEVLHSSPYYPLTETGIDIYFEDAEDQE